MAFVVTSIVEVSVHKTDNDDVGDCTTELIITASNYNTIVTEADITNHQIQ